MYYHGNLKILEAFYVGLAFSDHFALIVKIKLPENMSKKLSPKSKPLFKSSPQVVRDPIFQDSLKKQIKIWREIKENIGMNV